MMEESENTHEITCEITFSGRLDKSLTQSFEKMSEEGTLPKLAEGFSRARLQKLIKEGACEVDGKLIKDAKHKVEAGSVCLLVMPEPEEAQPQPEAMPLDIVYEDEDLLVINKPAGLVVHPGAGNWQGTLVNGLLAHCAGSLSGIGGVARPGIVHRLDKETSGLLVVAKNDLAHQKLSAQFSDRTLSRKYLALVWGLPPIEGEVEGNIGRHPRNRQKMAVIPQGGKEAKTLYKVVEAFGTLASVAECKLLTGRTHQIRVHMEHIGHPVVGDPVYGSRRRARQKGEEGIVSYLEAFPRQALHAAEIEFIHPRSDKLLKFKSDIPSDFQELLEKCRAYR